MSHVGPGINYGAVLDATTASGEMVQMRALGRPVRGRDFPVVWVCTEAEYHEVMTTGTTPQGIPWPLDAVTLCL